MEGRLIVRYFCLIIIIGCLVLTIDRIELEPNKMEDINVHETVSYEELWNQTYGGNSWEVATSIIQIADEGFVLGGYTRSFGAGEVDMWLVKTDVNGNHLWNSTFGGIYGDLAYSLVPTVDGCYALGGNTYSFGAGIRDMWLVKADSNGKHLWNQTYGGNYDDVAYSLVQTADGGFALAGYTYISAVEKEDFWLVKTDENGTHQWNQTYGGAENDEVFSILQTSDRGFILAGTTKSFDAKYTFAWVVKTDVNGTHEWNRTFGGLYGGNARNLIQTIDGGFAITGCISSPITGTDCWLIKMDENGTHQWNQTYGGLGSDSGNAVVQTTDGGFALIGSTWSLVTESWNMLLIKTDAFGNYQWNCTFGGEKSDSGCTLVQTTDGGYALAGDTESFKKPGTEYSDMWLVKVLITEIYTGTAIPTQTKTIITGMSTTTPTSPITEASTTTPSSSIPETSTETPTSAMTGNSTITSTTPKTETSIKTPIPTTSKSIPTTTSSGVSAWNVAIVFFSLFFYISSRLWRKY